jgi:hypothetical protein
MKFTADVEEAPRRLADLVIWRHVAYRRIASCAPPAERSLATSAEGPARAVTTRAAGWSGVGLCAGGPDWPVPMSLEENHKDLESHARDFRERSGFTYTILDGDEVIGCVYIYPPRREGFDAKLRSWVRASRAAMDEPVWRLLSAWLATEWPFERLDFAPRA